MLYRSSSISQIYQVRIQSSTMWTNSITVSYEGVTTSSAVTGEVRVSPVNYNIVWMIYTKCCLNAEQFNILCSRDYQLISRYQTVHSQCLNPSVLV